MKLRKMWMVLGVAIIIGILMATLFGTGIMAKDSNQAMGTNSLTVYANTALGFIPGITNPSDACIELSKYLKGQEIVWRIRVLDEALRPMDDTQLKSVVVEIPGGPTLPATYGGHGMPEPTDYFWAVAWIIPEDFSTGTYPYQVVATALQGRRTGTFNDFNVLQSQLTIVAPPS
jgi:hypothetical protein